MKWSRAKFKNLVAVGLIVAFAGVAEAVGPGGDGLMRLSDLQDGMEFDSGGGEFHFSDFAFTLDGLEEDFLSDYLVAPRSDGFRLVIGFGGSPFGSDSTLHMTYTVTTNSRGMIDAAMIPYLGLFNARGATPFAEVELTGSNGALIDASTTGASVEDVTTEFDGQARLAMNQVVALSGSGGLVKVDNGFGFAAIPEPGTGALLLAGIGAAWAVARRRQSA